MTTTESEAVPTMTPITIKSNMNLYLSHRQFIATTALAAGGLAVQGCSKPPPAAHESTTADTVYTGGNINTINDTAPSAEALAVRGGKIIAVGAKADVFKTQGAATKVVDLGGKSLLPGLVDAHSHFNNALSIVN